MSEAFEGGCLCGAVRYRVTAAPMLGGHCHCVDCRKSSGSAHCSHLGVPAEAFSLTGQVTQYDRPADSGNMIGRCFCPTCGAPVYSTNSGMPQMIFVRASSLDDPEVFQPQVVVYARSAPSWDHMDESLPSFPAMPPNMPGA